jgi:hypothetical protein
MQPGEIQTFYNNYPSSQTGIYTNRIASLNGMAFPSIPKYNNFYINFGGVYMHYLIDYLLVGNPLPAGFDDCINMLKIVPAENQELIEKTSLVRLLEILPGVVTELKEKINRYNAVMYHTDPYKEYLMLNIEAFNINSSYLSTPKGNTYSNIF